MLAYVYTAWLQQANSVELVKALLAAGASNTCSADLYDGDTPLQLAQRLKFTDVAALFEKEQ
jgi:ankyrin repeat protein